VDAAGIFGPEQVERGRRYHRPRYLALLLDLGLTLVVLGLLAWSGLGDALFRLVDGLPWRGEALLFPGLVLAVLELVRLPLSFWRGYLHEHRFGLSTQNVRGWAVDKAKAFAVSVVLATLSFFGFYALVHALPDAWPVVAAPAAALVVGFLAFVAPVVLEPIFNRFEPVADEELAQDLRALSRRAAVPVRDVLVADASRRTAKSNGYVSGIGKTRRVVLFDTLLERARPDELRVVVAHELAHRKYRDVVTGTALGMAFAAAAVVGLWLLLGDDAAEPRTVPEILFWLTLAQPLPAAVFAAVSRRWEYRADRFALELTGDLGAFERAFLGLTESNISDLDPPRPVYLLLFTHPTPPERIAAARRLAHRLPAAASG
jgi:STE24 endopeptidase